MKKSISKNIRIKLHYNTVHTINQLDIWDSRFINSCLVGSDQGVMFEREKMYPVDICKYAELSSIHYGEAFDKALEVAQKLRDTCFAVKLPNGLTYESSLVFSITHDKAMKLFLIHWNENFIPLVSGHMKAGDFITPRVDAASFSSNKRYSFYLYLEKNLHLLNKQENFSVSKEELRSILQLHPTEYKEFKMITAKIIKPALKDIYNKLAVPLQVRVKGTRVIFSYGEPL